MIPDLRHVLQLIVLYILLLSGGILLLQQTTSLLSPATFATLTTLMTLITFGAYLLAMAGRRKGEKEQGLWLLAALGGKFLAYLLLILVFWAVGKNLTKDFIIAFFVLYLVLTIFLVSVLYKALKNN